MSFQSDLQLIEGVVSRLDAAKPANFAYTEDAFENDEIEGVENFDIDAGQNIPLHTRTEYADFLLSQGARAQGASIPRMAWNHFIGRFSYNLRKLTRKVLEFAGIFSSALAHNACEYDGAARYRNGDTCYAIETIGGLKTYTWYNRVSASPPVIQNVPPTVSQHWAPMQEKTSFDSIFPFSASGYKHKFSIADLTGGGFSAEHYYPVVTDSFDAGLDAREIPARVLIEAFTRGMPPSATAEIRADIAVLSKFTGFGASSKDVLLDQEYIRLSDGAALPANQSPIGYTKLPRGKQAAVWLKGGQKYALWNSFGADFELHAAEWTNGLDEAIAPVSGARPLGVKPATILAKLETPEAVKPNEAPNLRQVTGALPLPVRLSGGETLRSLRKPGTYIAPTDKIGNSLSDIPPAAAEPGVCDIVVKGDTGGLLMTVQQIIPRATGIEYTRVLMGETVVIDWYKSKSPTGMDVTGVEGLWALKIEDGDLYVYYAESDAPPPLFIDYDPDSPDFGHLFWGVKREAADEGLVQTWLAAVETKADLPNSLTLDPDTNYLCRVLNDAVPANNGVWRLIAGAEEWAYFSDSFGYVDEAELALAMAQGAEARNTAIAAAVGNVDLVDGSEWVDEQGDAVGNIDLVEGSEWVD
jgi:hypothetical protein